jgi:hypothetical protein
LMAWLGVKEVAEGGADGGTRRQVAEGSVAKSFI